MHLTLPQGQYIPDLGIQGKIIKPDYSDARFRQFGVLAGEGAEELVFNRENFISKIAVAASKYGLVLFRTLTDRQRASLRSPAVPFGWDPIPPRSDHARIPHTDGLGPNLEVSALWRQKVVPGSSTGFVGIEPGLQVMNRHFDLLAPLAGDSELFDVQKRLRDCESSVHETDSSLAQTIQDLYHVRQRLEATTGTGRGKRGPFIKNVHAGLRHEGVWAFWDEIELAVVANKCLHFAGDGDMDPNDLWVCDLPLR